MWRPHFVASPDFDAKIFWWTGLGTFEPASNDYRPLLPWLGIVLLGVALGRWLTRSRHGERSEAIPAAVRPERGLGGAVAFCGRHSLPFYLVHQPVLFGLFTALSLVVAPPPDAGLFLRQCAVQCVDDGAAADLCEKSCACVMDRAKKDGLWSELAQNRLTRPQKERVHDAAVACYAGAVGK